MMASYFRFKLSIDLNSEFEILSVYLKFISAIASSYVASFGEIRTMVFFISVLLFWNLKNPLLSKYIS